MLTSVGCRFLVHVPNIDEGISHEKAKRDGWTAARLATTLALEKARTVSPLYPRDIVLGSDQVLEIESDFISKAKDCEEAFRNLSRLSGKKHWLVSAAVLLKDKTEPRVMVDRATLVMRSLNPRQIRRYLDLAGTGILGSVGCYHIEGLGPILFENVEGDIFTIRGLPLHQVLSALRDFGYDPLTNIHRPIRSPVNL